MNNYNELLIPEAAKNDLNSLEIVRIWIANKGLHVCLKADVWKDPFAYGIMLCDLVHHIANAFAQEQGLDRNQTVERIMAGLQAELKHPTDTPTGDIIE
jgi:hypothetical protein